MTEQTHHIIIPSYAAWFDYNRYQIPSTTCFFSVLRACLDGSSVIDQCFSTFLTCPTQYLKTLPHICCDISNIKLTAIISRTVFFNKTILNFKMK